MRHKIYRRAAAIFVVLLVFAQMVQVSWSYHEEQRQAALTGQEAEPEKLTLWYTDEKLNPYLVEAAEEFEQQNHVEITLQLVTAVDYIEHINTASISDLGGPDLFITSSELLEKARLAGLTVENDSFTERELEDAFPQQALNAASCGGHRKCASGVYRRKDRLYHSEDRRDCGHRQGAGCGGRDGRNHNHRGRDCATAAPSRIPATT